MLQIQRHALVLHSAMKMFRLVEDVGSYPVFLSWCKGTRVMEQTEERQLASLSVSFGGLEQRFTTRNQLARGESVQMSLVDGPFRSLDGLWQFQDIGNSGCKVSLSLKFEFAHSLLSIAFERGFAHVADRLVKDFCQRADTVYG